MKSDQVASRNWRRGQCQSLSLSRSRSWQQRSLQRSVICALALAFNLFALCATATIPPPLPPPVQGTLTPHATSLVLCRQLGLALGLNCATVHRYRWAYLHNYRFIPSRPPFSILHSIAFHCILHSTAFPSPPSPIPPFCCIPCPLASAPDSDLDSPFDVDRKLATAALFSNENYCIYY